jgi:hypothetical protein
MYIQFFPVYGLMLGFNYWNTNMDEFEDEGAEEIEHLFQLIIGVIGISIHVWRSK